MKTAIINRGVVGSGKSSFAKILKESAENMAFTCTVHNTDTYFMVDGEYRFDASRLGLYHNYNLQTFIRSMKEGVNVVICDNTNTTQKEYEKYVNEAKNAGYYVIGVVFIPDQLEVHCSRNTHNVPEEVVGNMIHRLNNNLETFGVDHEVKFKPNKQGMSFSERVIELVAQIMTLK